jgi:TetR/AcrR family transcriptional regulator, transcriptional repressor for nem operon
MRQPEITKNLLLQQAGILFNTKGYKATSISDITKATGLTKGAIYRHFENKDALEAAAFEYLCELIFSKLRKKIKDENTAGDKIRCVFAFFEMYLTKSTVIGGCPILNVAIEVDDAANSLLRKKAVDALNNIKNVLVHVLQKGKQFGQIKKDAQLEQTAEIIVASLEGAIMMSKLKKSSRDLKTVIAYLNTLLETIEV